MRGSNQIILYSISFIITIFSVQAQDASESIRLNQLGYLPESEKIAVVVDTDQATFEIINSKNSSVVYSGALSPSEYWSSSQERARIADFSEFKTRGTYYIRLGNGSISHTFTISDDVFYDLVKGSIKAYYFNRASLELKEEFAGEYKRPLGHPDDQVVVHPSAASANRPAGTIISTAKGWYDAGDFNKYIVNSGISVFTLLSAYENYQGFYDSLILDIPEKDNNIPDILDEAFWNIEWMSTMQDEDGGVYNKTTTAYFQGAVMPHQANATRYVVSKGTAATLDFAAVMAMAARVYQPYLPGFANDCLEKAELAWNWALANPDIPFTNPGAQDGYPSINTGEYGDNNFEDEFFWAASELYITTKNENYYNSLDFSQWFSVPGWPNVATLGILSLINHRKEFTSVADTTSIKNILYNITDELVNYRDNSSPYKIPNNQFYWGSNSIPANQGMLLMQAYHLTGDINYFNTALSALDYLLGRNATTFSFVTHFGDHTPQNIHHRQSEADNIPAPIPGFLVGGPNPHNTYDCGSEAYPSLIPAKSYFDSWCSYSTNEVTINWNAPLVYTAGAIHATYSSNFKIPDTTVTLISEEINNNVIVYPNPADKLLYIIISNSDEKPELQLYDGAGKMILQTNGNEIDVTLLKTGFYILKINIYNSIITKQILIK
ncbi:MAG: glycoside hydrolase family 9 protein [Candidatus Cyclobacteriaceae bacterium M2_1C_046]